MKTQSQKNEAVNRLLADKFARWTRAGAFALVEHLEALEADSVEGIEFDPVAIRCEWTEAESLQDWADGNGLDLAEDEEIRAYIEESGTLLEFDGGVIVSVF